VAEDLLVLPLHHRAQVLARLVGGRQRPLRLEAERAQELRAAVDVRGARLPERALDGDEVPVALQLRLHLEERRPGTDALDHGDRVERYLGLARAEQEPDAAPVRAERRDRGERAAVERRRQQVEHVRGQRGQLRRRLELEPAAVAGELQLPGRELAFHPVTERDAEPREPVVRRVVVRGREDPAPHRLAAELLQAQRARAELDLPLQRAPHGRSDALIELPTGCVAPGAAREHTGSSPPDDPTTPAGRSGR
jgi:hypothetical protein